MFCVDNEYFNGVVNALKKYDEVDCIVLGGSRATGNNDKMSDFDIYVYCKDELSIEKKKTAVLPYCCNAEVGNHYWELEDNCILKDNVGLDIIYRDVNKFENYLSFVVDGAKAFNGYTTCFWHNIKTSKIIFDKSGKFSELQSKYTIDFPSELRKNIIENNRKLLNGTLPSYDVQIKRAEQRGDIISIHHRTTEFLASYFDIIFALNNLTHPGEKRIVELCKRDCKILPNNFEENIKKLLSAVSTGGAYEVACDIVKELDLVLKSNGF